MGFSLKAKIKAYFLEFLDDGEVKKATDKAAAEAVVRLLRGMADAIEKDLKK
jgi:hypothetical protein